MSLGDFSNIEEDFREVGITCILLGVCMLHLNMRACIDLACSIPM